MSQSTTRDPVLMIALDASEITLLETFLAQGKLPALGSLMEQGRSGVLESPADLFTGGIWQSFYTAKEVPWHGMYHNKMWRHEKMRSEMATDGWLTEKPFWHRLDPERYRVALIDVPSTIGAPVPLNGVHLAGWASHETTVRGGWPADLWKTLKRRFGPPILPHEIYKPQTADTLLAARDILIDATNQVADIAESFLRQERWDLFFCGLGATHRGGHLLWSLSQIDTSGLSRETIEAVERSLLEVYQTCDAAIGRLLQAAPSDAKVLVFAVHGMGPEPGWMQRFPAMLSLIQRRMNAESKAGLLYRMRNRVPWQVAYQISERVPQAFLNWMVTIWSKNMYDWKTTRYFPVLSDLPGQVRINLKGREPEGIVEPGEEYDAICAELKRALMTFRDVDTGEAIVEHVYRSDEIAGKEAPYLDRIPDLIVQWRDVSSIDSRGIRSEEFGELRWDRNEKLRSGRSGNHRNKGWFVARGGGISPGRCDDEYRAVDLVPTLFEWLEAGQGADFQGKPIPDLCRAPRSG